MKTIISSILIIAGMITMHSCRQQDEEQEMDLKIQDKEALSTETYKNSDSTEVNVRLENPIEGTIDTDPPPKDRDQWRKGK
ncbi:hypothetical protein [Chryseobacterium glaciei]|nr:hypothetical protein [Chryseobacterium glaciei]